MQKIIPNLWFDKEAEEAVDFYVSVFKDAKKGKVTHFTETGKEIHGQPAGLAMTVEFELFGQKFVALNGGPQFKFNESVSFVVKCGDQAEIDYYWEKLSADPEAEACGWLKDKYGLSWQIVPEGMDKLVSDEKAMEAMLRMKKLIIAELEAAGKENNMQNAKSTFYSVSVDDMAAAKEFYTKTLGLELKDEDMGLHLVLPGGPEMFVYQKDNYEPASHTVLNFVVDDIETAVSELREKGVEFEQYDWGPKGGKTDENGIMRGPGAEDSDPTMAWFKDPAGNTLGVLQA